MREYISIRQISNWASTSRFHHIYSSFFFSFLSEKSRVEKRPVLSARVPFIRVFRCMCLVIGTLYMYPRARVTRLSLWNVNCCFTFQLPHRASIDQSDYAQQRDDCCKAIYDFSLCICFRWQIWRSRVYDDHDHGTDS